MWWGGISGLDSPVAAVPGNVPGFRPGSTLAEHYARATGHDLSGVLLCAVHHALHRGQDRPLP
ncbi:hypothetical protein L1857_25790 [Amycolatopsis thermalba]|uniref:Uncharacterized protein n=1 Tax=Amycolatopsis thermalba TaxID=944492 RepID=A0ABY4P0U5_9PSEU|nr:MULTISPECIES: hypothetical protein [Amycolatopsis]UQS25975.1 hypothetical protein L1857_25790 [Amycolatopsis thermalba]